MSFQLPETPELVTKKGFTEGYFRVKDEEKNCLRVFVHNENNLIFEDDGTETWDQKHYKVTMWSV